MTGGVGGAGGGVVDGGSGSGNDIIGLGTGLNRATSPSRVHRGSISSNNNASASVNSPIRSNTHPMFGTPGSRSAGSKRNLNSAGLDSSPGSVDDHQEGDDGDEKKRQPVKRACNECRQQKV